MLAQYALILAASAADVNWLGLLLGLALSVLLVGVSAAYSSSETILFSLSPLQLHHARHSSNPLRRIAAELMQRPDRTLMTILVGNTAANVLIYATAFLVFQNLAVLMGSGAATLLSAVYSIVLVTLGAEVVPKVVGVTMTERFVPVAAAVVHFSGYVLTPVGLLVDFLLVRPCERLLWGVPQRDPDAAHALSRDELKALLEISRRHGVINPTEDELLREVIDLHSWRVRDVMVPRVEVVAFDVNGDPEALRALFRESRRKKIPVYDETPDNVIGLVYAKMFFLAPQKSLREIAQPVRFVPEIITCEQLLHHFRVTRTQLAIAVDEFGGMAGLVTLKDVLEAIVGELNPPEGAEARPEIVQVTDDVYDISGALSVHYWAQTFGIPRLTERVATVGGLVISRLGRPPRVGDVVRLANVELRVTAVGRRRIDRLELRLLAPPEAPAAQESAA